MTIQSVAGLTLHISAGTPATYDSTGYNALTWTEVGEITNPGEWGRVYELIRHNPVKTRGTQKMKGTFDEGALSLQLALDTDDAGQILMKTARDSDSAYSVKITMQNTDKYFMQALVMGFRVSAPNPNSIVAASATLEITTNSAGVGIVESLAA